MATYRILSLDGGGTWALLQIMALQKIYAPDTAGHQVLKDFNLVAANGAGCITLAGLMLDMPLGDILTKWFLNEDLRRSILAPSSGFFSKVFGNGAKYSTKKKRAALKTLLGDLAERKLASVFDGSKPRILLPQILMCAYDCDRNRAECFRSDRASRCASASASDPFLVDAIHAATTAPYPLFDLPAKGTDGRFWDGAAAGLYNPILAAVTEARANRVDAAEISRPEHRNGHNSTSRFERGRKQEARAAHKQHCYRRKHSLENCPVRPGGLVDFCHPRHARAGDARRYLADPGFGHSRQVEPRRSAPAARRQMGAARGTERRRGREAGIYGIGRHRARRGRAHPSLGRAVGRGQGAQSAYSSRP